MKRLLQSVIALAIVFSFWAINSQADPATNPLIDLAKSDPSQWVPSCDQVSVKRSDFAARAPAGIDVAIQPGKAAWPGISYTPATPWDLSNFGDVRLKVTNTGATKMAVALSIQNEGPWQEHRSNDSVAGVMPGKSLEIKVIFGYSNGTPGYALNPKAITKLLIFSKKTDVPLSFRIDSLEGGGSPGEKIVVDPAMVRVAPKDGVLLGADTKVDPATQFKTQGIATADVARQADGIAIAAPGNDEASITFEPATGMWDLSLYLQTKVTIKNTGSSPINPRARLESKAGPTDAFAAESAIAPGAEGTITIPFFTQCSLSGEKGEKITGSQYASYKTTGVTILPGKDAQKLVVTSIAAVLPDAPPLPDWLGKRPPVDGEWTQTLDENFDGDKLNTALWNTRESYDEPNRIYQATKNAVRVSNGLCTLTFDKKPAYMDDDPTKMKADYEAGYIDTYGKWRQRYGYFESRFKWPTGQDMFPAFWLMPDRGGSDVQWKRQSTANGGMEFDIFESETIWGPYRHDCGQHWDGYLKNHKSSGIFNCYLSRDKDGFVTCGLLWLPGKVVYYDNGHEVMRWENPRIGSVPEIIIFDNWNGGWDHDPLDDKILPQNMVIDYVRVWQRRDLASPVDGKMTDTPESKAAGG